MLRVLALALCSVLVLTALPGLAGPQPALNAGGRIVPEPMETNDYLSYPEARAMLDAIAQAAPGFVEVVEVGESFGWDNTLTGTHDTWPVVAVEVTNEASPLPREQKRVALFQLSIHGNEKGGREGGLRVIEDLAIPLGMGQGLRDLLDEVLVIFTFPNVDGWMHEDPAYRANCPNYFAVELPTGDCVETQSFVRFNGHGQDMNRDWATAGWYQTGGGREQAFSEPEMRALDAYLRPFKGRVVAAADIHGMLNPSDGGVSGAGAPFPASLVLNPDAHGTQAGCLPANPAGVECAYEGHFVLGLPVGNKADPVLNLRVVRLYERAKEQLNAMAEQQFPYWTSSPNAGTAGGQWSEWGTGWDTIGYTDSGSTGRWFAEGLGAPGGTFEMSYNHITFDNHYIPELNKMHVESVRAIVSAFLEEARAPARPSLGLVGTAAFLDAGPRVASAGDAPQEGPHANSTDDDPYEQPYEVHPQRFWRDLARYLPADALVPVGAADVNAGRFHQHRTLVIAGDAWDEVAGRSEALLHLRMHLDQGGRLFLTDKALLALEALGLAERGSVEQGEGYLGYVDLQRDHTLAQGVRGLARQTYDGVSVGYPIPSGGDGFHAPIWTVRADAVQGLDLAGTTFGEDRASFGAVKVGQGEVVFLGALLPTPTEDAYHPYGLNDYAVTYTGYQLAYNALGITEQAQEGDALPEQAPGPPRPAPGPEAGALAVGLGLLALAARRR